jgi:hypothetical protein
MMNTEVNAILIPNQILSDLEKIAWLLFPMEVECTLIGEIKGNAFAVSELILGNYYFVFDQVQDVRYYRGASDFEGLIQGFQADIEYRARGPLEREKIAKIRLFRFEASQLYDKYKECQRRRKFKECMRETWSRDCKQCPAPSPPKTPQGGMFFSDLPACSFLFWHSHPTSEYGDLVFLSSPSHPDSARIVMWRLRAEELGITEFPLLAEVITAVSEQNQYCTKAFTLPQERWINPPFERKEIEIITI